MALISIILGSAEVGHGGTFIFPEQGQSQVQQTQDLHDCSEQAREETDFDPRRSLSQEDARSPQAQSQRQERIKAYNQVFAECLKTRGYTIR